MRITKKKHFIECSTTKYVWDDDSLNHLFYHTEDASKSHLRKLINAWRTIWYLSFVFSSNGELLVNEKLICHGISWTFTITWLAFFLILVTQERRLEGAGGGGNCPPPGNFCAPPWLLSVAPPMLNLLILWHSVEFVEDFHFLSLINICYISIN